MKITICILIMFTLALTGCGSPSPNGDLVMVPTFPVITPTISLNVAEPVNNDLETKETIIPNVPGEIVRVRGEGPGKSAIFSIDNSGPFEIHWGKDAAGTFNISLVRTSAADSSQYELILLINGDQEVAGLQAAFLNSGEYVMQIEDVVGSWEIWLSATTGSTIPNSARAGELLRLESNSTGAGPIFSVPTDGNYPIHWDYSSDDRFILSLSIFEQGTEESVSSILVTDTQAVSTGVTYMYLLSEKRYQLTVQAGDYDWQAWINLIN